MVERSSNLGFHVVKVSKVDVSAFIYTLLCFFYDFIYFTSFREQDKADFNSLRWSALVGLEPAYTRM